MTDTEMAAPTAAAAMAAVTIEPEKRLPMTISFLPCGALRVRDSPHQRRRPLRRLGRVYRGSDCGEKLILMAKLGVETAQQSDSVVRLRAQRPAETFVTSAVD